MQSLVNIHKNLRALKKKVSWENMCFILSNALHVLWQYSTFIYLFLQGTWTKMDILNHVKTSTVAWVGTVSWMGRVGRLNAFAWSVASHTTNLCVAQMESSMKTTVRYTGLPAWRSRRSPLSTMKIASSKVSEADQYLKYSCWLCVFK